MNKSLKAAVITGGVAVALAIGLAVFQRSDKLPPAVFDRMQFGDGFAAVIGNESGVVCHQVFLCQDGACDMIVSHKLWDHDFRTMTEAQKRAAIIADTRRDMEDVGLACTRPDGSRFLSEALAQPHCDQCGGGCDTKTCPGTITQSGGCALGGINCVITFICCSGSCPNC